MAEMEKKDLGAQAGQTGQRLPPAKLLNANHRRTLAVTLRRVELAVWRLEERLAQAESPPQLALTCFTNPPDAQQRRILLQLTKEIREEVAKLAADFKLPVGEENMLRTIMAEFSLLWCDLEDVRPEKLSGYGPVNPAVYPLLDPPIERLIRLVLLIDAVAKGRQDVLNQWQEDEQGHTNEQEAR